MIESALQSAYRVLQDSVIHYRGKPVGTMAACDPEGLAVENYQDCFIRDFAVSAVVVWPKNSSVLIYQHLLVVFDLTTMRKVYDYAFEKARMGYEWAKVPSGLDPAELIETSTSADASSEAM